MATINYTETSDHSAGSAIITIRWDGMAGATSDVGQPFACAGLPDKSVHLIGSLATFALQGSNDDPVNANWVTLTNEAHTPITDTGGARIEVVLQNTRWIRPSVTGAASGVSVVLTGRRLRGDGGTG